MTTRLTRVDGPCPCWRRSSSPSARSTGTPRCCRRRGSWPTSWPSRSCCSASPSRWTASGASARTRRCPRCGRGAGSGAQPDRRRVRGQQHVPAWYRRARPYFEPVQFMAGFVFGVAALARLTVIFAAPFFLFVGPGGSFCQARRVGRARRRHPGAAAARLQPALERPHLQPGLRLPVPLREYLRLHAARTSADRTRSLGIEDIGHIPLNALIMFGWPPEIMPGPSCGLPAAQPRLPAHPARPDRHEHPADQPGVSARPFRCVIRHWRQRDRGRLGCWRSLAVAFVNLMHFSQGWVQFGYRFSNDFAPFALVLVTLGHRLARPTQRGRPRPSALVALSSASSTHGACTGE